MGHRDGLLMTLNLSEAKNHGCRPHLRGSVRRASGFVLTGYAEVIPGDRSRHSYFRLVDHASSIVGSAAHRSIAQRKSSRRLPLATRSTTHELKVWSAH